MNTALKNWKTTLGGLIGGVASFLALVASNPVPFSQWSIQAQAGAIVAALGIAGFGAAAKDGTTHSTTSEVQTATVNASPSGTLPVVGTGESAAAKKPDPPTPPLKAT